ncbi:MAG: hypothetical protein R6U44_03675 [Archaeoglobaceae archaeon]
MKDDRGVSNQVGLILIFGLVIIAMGMIYSGTKPIVDGAVNSNHEMEIAQAFDLLYANLNKVVFEDVPVRVTEMRTYKGSITVSDSSYIKFDNSTINLGRITYQEGNREIIVENGGVFEKYETATLISKEPKVITAGNTTVLPVISLRDMGSTSGEGILRIRLDQLGSGTFEAENKTITIHSSLKDKWIEILQDKNFSVTTNGDTINATCQSEKLLIRYTSIKVEMLR